MCAYIHMSSDIINACIKPLRKHNTTHMWFDTRARVMPVYKYRRIKRNQECKVPPALPRTSTAGMKFRKQKMECEGSGFAWQLRFMRSVIKSSLTFSGILENIIYYSHYGRVWDVLSGFLYRISRGFKTSLSTAVNPFSTSLVSIAWAPTDGPLYVSRGPSVADLTLRQYSGTQTVYREFDEVWSFQYFALVWKIVLLFFTNSLNLVTQKWLENWIWGSITSLHTIMRTTESNNTRILSIIGGVIVPSNGDKVCSRKTITYRLIVSNGIESYVKWSPE